MVRYEVGAELLKKMIAALGPKAIVESPPKLEGSNMTMVLAPANAPPPTRSGGKDDEDSAGVAE